MEILRQIIPDINQCCKQCIVHAVMSFLDDFSSPYRDGPLPPTPKTKPETLAAESPAVGMQLSIAEVMKRTVNPTKPRTAPPSKSTAAEIFQRMDISPGMLKRLKQAPSDSELYNERPARKLKKVDFKKSKAAKATHSSKKD